MFNSSGASSHQLLHYLDVHLNDKLIDVGIIEVIINVLLTNSSRSRSGMNNLTSNIKKNTEKCLMFGVKNVFGWFAPLGLMCLYLKESMF